MRTITKIIVHCSATPRNKDFSAEDINPASEYYGQNVGPSFFDDQVSCYYFAKQG